MSNNKSIFYSVGHFSGRNPKALVFLIIFIIGLVFYDQYENYKIEIERNKQASQLVKEKSQDFKKTQDAPAIGNEPEKGKNKGRDALEEISKAAADEYYFYKKKSTYGVSLTRELEAEDIKIGSEVKRVKIAFIGREVEDLDCEYRGTKVEALIGDFMCYPGIGSDYSFIGIVKILVNISPDNAQKIGSIYAKDKFRIFGKISSVKQEGETTVELSDGWVKSSTMAYPSTFNKGNNPKMVLEPAQAAVSTTGQISSIQTQQDSESSGPSLEEQLKKSVLRPVPHQLQSAQGTSPSPDLYPNPNKDTSAAATKAVTYAVDEQIIISSGFMVVAPEKSKKLLTVMLQQATSAFKVSEIKGRIETFAKPATGDRKMARKLNEQGLAALKSDDFAQGLDSLKNATSTDPADIEILNNYVFALIKSKRLQDAESEAGRLLTISPGRSSGWANLAEVYALKNRNEEAVAALILAFQFSSNKDRTITFLNERAGDISSPLQATAKRAIEIIQKM
jgi:hypothetical protein